MLQLAAKLRVGPPSLQDLVARFQQGEALMGFVRIVRGYVPEHEGEILANVGAGARIAAFSQHFAERHFPLDDNFMWGDVDEDEGYDQLMFFIPIPRGGMDWDDYQDFTSFAAGYQYMLALIESPYEAFGDEGSRVSLLDEVSKTLGKPLVKRIPKQGWPPQELHRLLAGTEFEAVALFADEVWHDTGTVFLDCTYDEDLSGLDWDRETVEYLTECYEKAQVYERLVHEMRERLEDDPRGVMLQVLDTLERAAAIPQAKPLVEVFSGN